MARDRCVTAMKIYFPSIVLVYDYLKLVKTSQKCATYVEGKF